MKIYLKTKIPETLTTRYHSGNFFVFSKYQTPLADVNIYTEIYIEFFITLVKLYLILS